MIPAPILDRRHPWRGVQAPPAKEQKYAHAIGEAKLAMTFEGAQLAVDESRMYIRRVISTIDRDRVGDEMVPQGCYTRNFLRSPGVFFGHQEVAGMHFPIGMSVPLDDKGVAQDVPLDVLIVPNKHIEAGCWFLQNGKWAQDAQDVFVLCRDRILRMTSVGFSPRAEPIPLARLDGCLYAGYRYEDWDLTEWSVVGTPMNPYAGEVRRYLSRGRIAGKSISPRLRKSLEPLAEPKRAWLATNEGRSMPMTETSGYAGGYTLEDKIAAKCGMEGHALYVRPDGATHHTHPADADAETLARIKDEVEGVEGMTAFTQGTEDPEGDDWRKVHPLDKKHRKAFPPPKDKSEAEVGEEEEETPDDGAGDQGGADMPALLGQLMELASRILAVTAPRQAPPAIANNTEDDGEDDATELPPADEDEPDEAEDEDRTRAAMDRYRRSENAQIRKMAPRRRGVIKAAADHLHAMAMVGSKDFGPEHKRACHAHARALDMLHGDVMAKDDEEEEDGGDEGGGEGEDKSLSAADLELIRKSLAPGGFPPAPPDDMDDVFFQLTGRRA